MPTLYVVGGCNGSGKSTFMRATFHEIATIDPDTLFTELKSWKAVIAGVNSLLAERVDLAVETTLAGRTMLRKMRAARAVGYSVVLIFIGTSSPALNVGRISTRTELGGHAILTSDVRRRWRTVLAHLPQAVEIANRSIVLDNSSVAQRFMFVAELERDTIVERAPRIPTWARSALPQL